MRFYDATPSFLFAFFVEQNTSAKLGSAGARLGRVITYNIRIIHAI
jgi:hypothetical protein